MALGNPLSPNAADGLRQLASVPETITVAAESEPLVRLIEHHVPRWRYLPSGNPLHLPIWLERLESAQHQGNEREAAICAGQIVHAYPYARAALLEAIATNAPGSRTPTRAVTLVGAPAARPEGTEAPPARWARQLLGMAVDGVRVMTVTPAPHFPEAIREGVQGVLLAQLITGTIPSDNRTIEMRRLVSLMNERVRLHLRPDHARRALVDAELVALYPDVLGQTRLLLDTPARAQALDEAEKQALEAAYQVVHEPANSTSAPASDLAQPSSALATLEPAQMASYVEQARDLLAKCNNVEEAKSFLNKADVVRAYLRSVHASLAARAAAEEVVLRARRRLGELTRGLPTARPGKKPILSQPATHSPGSKEGSLTELGITRQEASRLEKLANIQKSDFDKYIDATKAAGKTPTTSGALALAKNKKAANTTTPYAVAEAPRMRSHVGRLKSLQREMAQAAGEWGAHPGASLGDIGEAWNKAAATLGKAITTMEQVALPKDACPCRGAAQCQKCGGRGWLSREP